MRVAAALIAVATLLCAVLSAQTGELAVKTATYQKLPGFFPVYYDSRSGKLYLEIERFDSEFLYVDSLPAGIGSNDIGLDRGQPGASRVVKFERSGRTVLLTQVNYGFRASAENRLERRAVQEAFAQSVLWGFTVEAEEADLVLVDATAFFLHDAHHVAETLKDRKQGSFKLDASRSALYLPRTKNFPRNTEVEATLTFTGDEPGQLLRSVVPSPDAITVREHHSFIELPGPGYTPRAFDPRGGFIPHSYLDYSTPIGEPVEHRVIIRHRLIKKDPDAEVSEPVQPIVYYLDPGAPEPIRSALLEGANWWEQAFEAAGFRNAFQVKMLPDDVDPMDIRYNVIQWVHRSTRGWSYGSAITDPRTGEIIKGQVTLGSLRVRQDYMIAQGLVARFENGERIDPAALKMALARIRQLAAHEIGHTLGLSHNYIASTHDRASVMDYPPPYVKLAANEIDLSDAYATGIGAWDKVAINFGYRQFGASEDERTSLDGILTNAAQDGLIFLSDEAARPPGSAHPRTHLWDSGTDAVSELDRVMNVRTAALAAFDERRIRTGDPMGTLEDVFAPIYLFHRYQTEAAAKVLGGLDYTYALRGDGQTIAEIVPAAEQRRALTSLLATLDPKNLVIPERLLKLFPPKPHGYTRTRENFHYKSGLVFDSQAAIEAAADLTVSLILNNERASRLVEYHARDAKSPGLDEVLDKLLGATWRATRAAGATAEAGRTIDNVVLYRMMTLAADEEASSQARAIVYAKLDELRRWAETQAKQNSFDQRAHLLFAAHEIDYFNRNPKEIRVSKPAAPPDGAPIGSDFE